MGMIDRIRGAVDEVARAETALDELRALHELETLVGEARFDAAVSALRNGHPASAVGDALGGVSKQAINQRYGYAAKEKS